MDLEPFETTDTEVRKHLSRLNEEFSFMRNKDNAEKLDRPGLIRANIVLHILRLLVKLFGE